MAPSKKPSPTTTPVTKADLTVTMERVMAANKADLAAAMAVNKADLTQAIGQVLEVVKETRLQLERKIDWVRQDAKEQLEGVEKRLSGRIDKVESDLSKVESGLSKVESGLSAVESGLSMTQAAVLEVGRDMKEVKGTLADHGKKLDRLTEKVDEHDRAILVLQDARLP